MTSGAFGFKFDPDNVFHRYMLQNEFYIHYLMLSEKQKKEYQVIEEKTFGYQKFLIKEGIDELKNKIGKAMEEITHSAKKEKNESI